MTDGTKTDAAPAPGAKPPLTFPLFLYGVLRMIHLLWMSAVMPLAIVHIRSSGVPMTGLDAGIFYFAGCLWALMIVGIDQVAYPVRLRDAALTSGGTLAGIFLSFFASDGNLLFSAYTVFLASMITQTLLFLFVSVWMPLTMARGTAEKKELKFVFWITLAYLAFFGFTAWYTVKYMVPFVKYVAGMASPVLRVMACAAMALQVYAWGGQLLGSSILAKASPEKTAREASFERWVVPICLCLLASVLVSLFMFIG